MVKTTGPLMSLAASGSLANAITFSSSRGRPYVRQHVTPSNPKSGAQVGRRAMMKFLTQSWSGLSDADQATWENLAEQLVASRFNAYLSHNLQRWHNFLTPTHDYPATEIGTPADTTFDALVWEENRLKITLATGNANDNWGNLIFARPTSSAMEAVAYTQLVVLGESTGMQYIYWTPPLVTTWWVQTRTFTNDGATGTITTDRSATPP